jgi:hypothetical protein
MAVATSYFVGVPTQRATGTGDERYVNVLIETLADKISKKLHVYTIKRPGLSNSTQPPAGNATGRGVYAWGATGKIYSCFANKLYSGVTDLGVTLAASTGRVWFAETPETDSSQVLIVSDGTDNYNITTSDVCTQIDETDDAHYPTPNLGPIAYLDGYLFQGQSDGQLWNTDLSSVTSWAANSFTSSSEHGDALEALHIQKDQIILFGKTTICFYFNNGNPTGSPLLNVHQNALDMGLATRNSLAWGGNVCAFVAESASWGDGARSVWTISALGNAKEISTTVINRFLAAEGSSMSSCTAWMERVAGQLVYVLNLSSANRTFVYNFENETWTEWEIAAGGAKFNGIAATSLNGSVYVQDASNGRIYTFPVSAYQDSGANFTVTVQTNNDDRGSHNRKFEHQLDVHADNTTGNLSVSYTDDDYSSFSTARTIDLAQNKKRLNRLGSFYRRAYKYTYADNYPLRLKKAVHTFDAGSI